MKIKSMVVALFVALVPVVSMASSTCSASNEADCDQCVEQTYGTDCTAGDNATCCTKNLDGTWSLTRDVNKHSE